MRRFAEDHYEVEEEEEQEGGWLSNLWERIRGGHPEEEDEDEEVAPSASGRRTQGQVLQVHASRATTITSAQPKTLEQAQRSADDLRERRPVILNLENTDEALAQRILDFVSGVTYAMSGSYQQVGGRVFLFTPANMTIEHEGEETDTVNLGPLFGRAQQPPLTGTYGGGRRM